MKDEELLRLLSKDYPNIRAASAEIINLNAILALPKGTDYVLSDLHGEHEAFIHMINSASGVIARKVEETFGVNLREKDKDALASLIYNPEAEIKRTKIVSKDFDAWCKTSILRLIEVCKAVSGKYTRSKVRRRLPRYAEYSIDELLHANDSENKARYYNEIVDSIIDCDVAEEYITELAVTISRLAVDKLHILGDVYDRGAHPDKIMDFLMDFHDVDFQWGNHDMVWMGAATGNWACITNVLRMNISYNNFDMLEIGYGINLRPLYAFATATYGDDDCEAFKPHLIDKNVFDQVPEKIAAKMHKAIAVCQFKVEGQRIMAHPEYGLDNRLLLDKIDFDKGTITINDTTYELKDCNLPTVDPADPYKLSAEEEDMLNKIEASFHQSEKLQMHIRFMYSHGAMYKVVNGNLLYHGCIPISEDGGFEDCSINGKTCRGKELLDYLDDQVRKAYFSPDESEEIGRSGDLMWYLWLGGNSPLFGKDRMTTFERCFIADKASHKEHTRPYYRLRDSEKICDMILEEFSLDTKHSKILNGHVPVKIKDGESPVKGGGKLLVIDGGMSKAYQKQTGIAGYTFIFNSWFMGLAEHKPYSPLREDGTQEFHKPVISTVEVLPERMTVRESDDGPELVEQVERLKELLSAYRRGIIKEQY